MTKARASGIELLRILAMLLIVIGHVPHFYSVTPTASGFGLALLTNAGRVAVNLFLLVGVWFMVDAEFRAARLLKLHLSVLCYAVPLTAAAVFAGMLPPPQDVARCFFPLVGRPLWFVSAYLTLLLLLPFLSRAGRLSTAALGRLVLLLAVVVCTVCSLPDPQLTYFGDTAWFAAVYLFMLWFKRTSWRDILIRRRWLMLTVGLLGYASLVGALLFAPAGLSALADQYLFDFKTLPNFLVALCVFAFFVGLDLGSVSWINALARPSLAVYVFHQMPSFIPLLWGLVFPVARLSGCALPGVWLVLIACGVYALASLLEVVRLRLVEPVFVRMRFFDRLCRRMDGFYAPLSCGEATHA